MVPPSFSSSPFKGADSLPLFNSCLKLGNNDKSCGRGGRALAYLGFVISAGRGLGTELVIGILLSGPTGPGTSGLLITIPTFGI